MRFVKGFILAITGLFIVITLFSLLMPSRVLTVRSVVIHTTPQQVISKVADLQEWKKWHPLFMQDSAAVQVKTLNGRNRIAEWSNKGKANRLEITGVDTNVVRASLQRTNENKSDHIIAIKSLPGNNDIEVEWRVVTPLKWYPWEKFSGIFLDKMTGYSYETALGNLKLMLEGRP
jgi:Polyketide cyclase / dehydrase and lipid transport